MRYAAFPALLNQKCLLRTVIFFAIYFWEHAVGWSICTVNDDGATGVPSVFITVSSLAYARNGTVTQRQVELNWHKADPQNEDWIGLFRYDPANSTVLDPVAHNWIDGQRSGFYRTHFEFPRFNFTVENLVRDRCLNFWVGYIRNRTVLSSSCLQIRPQWMHGNKDIIGELDLTRLIIPGTHNAGSYQEYLGTKSEDVVTRYKICQDEDIWTQLVFGVRHFDFRVSYYRTHPEPYWINHGLVKVNPFSLVLQDIKNFASNSKEILFLDFHLFPVGFRRSRERHEAFMNLLVDELGDFLIPRSFGYHVTLNELWKRNKTIVLLYSNENYEVSDLFWPGLPQIWANTNKIESLKSYFDNYVNLVRPKPFFWSAMAELTPNVWDIVGNPTGNLRVMADKVNRNVTMWFRDLWSEYANIVATDFFLGNNMVDVAVRVNKRRALCSEHLTVRNET